MGSIYDELETCTRGSPVSNTTFVASAMDTNVPRVNTARFVLRSELERTILDLNTIKAELASLGDQFRSQTKAIRTRITNLENAAKAAHPLH